MEGDGCLRFLTISFLAALILVATAASTPKPITVPRFQNVHGYANPNVTQRNLSTTVCHRGYSSSVRPPTSYTNFIKTQLLHNFHLSGTISDYELDHLESISLGGSVYDTRNLWMQPWYQARPDDALEYKWYKQLCSGQVTLRYIRNFEKSYKQDAG
jgi:hypothetical protein